MALAPWVRAFGTPKKKKAPRPIKRVSDHQAERLKIYYRLRRKYLKEHPKCEVCKVRKSQDIHHKRGRIGENLFEHFLATCKVDHDFIHHNPKWAYEMGYLEHRL